VPPPFTAFGRGLGLGAGLIVAIGAQNAFVLRQGLRREGRLAVALVCTGCDALLIALGAGGFGALIARAPLLTRAAAWAGALFLLLYGLGAFRRALRPGSLAQEAPPATRGGLVATAFALSLLNPHVYLDTVVLVGGLAAQYPPRPRLVFAAGAMTASALWFFALAYGASALAPLFRRPLAWRVLDTGIGLVMWAIALSLVVGVK
jgi:L-lysine exporter family protein LysE/ArgO